jgi:archaellum component FlaC
MEKVRTVIDGLHRDIHSHTLVSVDVEGFKAYKRNRKQQLSLQSLDSEVQDLKQQINTLRQLLETKIGK